RTRKKPQATYPPLPAKPVEAFGGYPSRGTDGKRRQAKRLIGVGWITGEAGDSHFPIVCTIVRNQILVANGPVLGGSVQGPDTKIRTMKRPKFRIPVNGCTPYSVRHFDVGRVLAGGHHWIVLRPLTLVRAEAELRPLHLRLVIEAARRIVACFV